VNVDAAVDIRNGRPSRAVWVRDLRACLVRFGPHEGWRHSLHERFWSDTGSDNIGLAG
jgi:hypothetical protein